MTFEEILFLEQMRLEFEFAQTQDLLWIETKIDYFHMMMLINRVTASPNVDEISFTSSSLGSTKVESSISFGNITDIQLGS